MHLIKSSNWLFVARSLITDPAYSQVAYSYMLKLQLTSSSSHSVMHYKFVFSFVFRSQILNIHIKNCIIINNLKYSAHFEHRESK